MIAQRSVRPVSPTGRIPGSSARAALRASRACVWLASAATLAIVLTVGAPPARAQRADDVFPLEPEDGVTVGAKPKFQVGAEGADLYKLKFRIVMSEDGFDTEAYVFDQAEDKAGWVYTGVGGEFGAIYRAKEPLADGDYEWRADVWNGLDWLEGETTYRVTVDSIPPADVDGLVMDVIDDGAGISLEWDAVTTDQDGRPEYVEKYRVYRYNRRSFFFVVRPFQIAEVDFPRYVDRDLVALSTPLVFYKVTAVDAADNEPERRY